MTQVSSTRLKRGILKQDDGQDPQTGAGSQAWDGERCRAQGLVRRGEGGWVKVHHTTAEGWRVHGRSGQQVAVLAYVDAAEAVRRDREGVG